MQQSGDRRDQLLVNLPSQGAGSPHHKRFMSGEELAWSSVALPPEAPGGEGPCPQRDGRGVTVGIARDLAQDPVTPPGVGEDHSRPQLR